jgi:hypothetical protein
MMKPICVICGGTEFGTYLDNFGVPYQGCAKCRIVRCAGARTRLLDETCLLVRRLDGKAGPLCPFCDLVYLIAFQHVIRAGLHA